MAEFKPNFDQNYAYFAARLPEERMAKTKSVSVCCPFHQDKNPSMGINLEIGGWKCHVCNEGGGIFAFEKRMFPNQDVDTCWKEIYRLCGMPAQPSRKDWDGYSLTRTYDYTDATGVLVFQKLRFDHPDKANHKKRFTQRQPVGKGAWEKNLNGVKKVLYKLPDLIVARMAIVVEGEKCVEATLPALQDYINEHPKQTIAVTTNFDGAKHWLPSYNAYFAGKLVVVIPDCNVDGQGLEHAHLICKQVSEFAAKVKLVELPGLKDKEDIADWLAAGHTFAELHALIMKAPLWQPLDEDHKLLVEMQDFLDIAPPEMDWIIQGVIPAKTNGLLVAYPKAGKSLVTFDLALAVAAGTSWLGFPVVKRQRVALISREDAPTESSRRLASLRAGAENRQIYSWGQIWLNTRYQSPSFLLENAEDVNQLIKEMQMEQIDLAIFDVFRRLHNQDENDNTAMAKILESLIRIQTEVNCAILLVHHLTKEENTNIFRGARGAGAIHGWTEYGVGITVVDESAPRRDWIRKVEFELKYAPPPDPVYFQITGPDMAPAIEVVAEPESNNRQAPRREKVKQIASGRSWQDGRD